MTDLLSRITDNRQKWRRRNWYYHSEVAKLISSLVPPRSRVLYISGEETTLLAAYVSSTTSELMTLDEVLLTEPQNVYTSLNELPDVKVDFIVVTEEVGLLRDVQTTLSDLQRFCTPETRLAVVHYSHLWAPVLRLAERLRLKMPQPPFSWLSRSDIRNLLLLSGYSPVLGGHRTLLPKYVPGLSYVFNGILSRIPIIEHLGLLNFVVARPVPPAGVAAEGPPPSCSIVVPCRNERGNIRNILHGIPDLGTEIEVIFVEGGSTDGTRAEIDQAISEGTYPFKLRVLEQTGKGKADAVWTGFNAATNDILMILDADLTVSPNELPKFYRAIVAGTGELIIGSRLVYPLESGAMRTANLIGNKLFSWVFSWILDQPVKDTLCGTKVLWRRDFVKYRSLPASQKMRDPFGDFDLLFGGRRLCLDIREIPIRYKERTYGTTNIRRWYHGLLLLRMALAGMGEFKFGGGQLGE